MRFVEIQITPKRGWFHPADKLVRPDLNIKRKSVQQITLLEDGTVVMLYELAGDHDHIRKIVETYFEALAHSTSEVGDNVLVWLHIEPSSLVRGLLEVPQRYNVIMQMPLEFTKTGGIQCVFVGDEQAITEATKALPEEVQVDVERFGEYDEGAQRFTAELTERQLEVLDAAIELGYYQNPREATYDDIAEAIGVSRTTIGQHLRTVEAKVLPGIRP